MINAATTYENTLFTTDIIQFPTSSRKRTNSCLKSNGVPKATAADPIRSIDEVHAMQQYFIDNDEIRNYALFTLGISFALRAGDLLSLKFGDVFTADWCVKDKIVLYEDKTNKRNVVSINKHCKTVLKSYLDYCMGKLGARLDWRWPLFYSRTKAPNGFPKPISIQMLNQVLKRAAKDCNISGHISSHSMRKTFVYQMIQAHQGDQNTLLLLQQMLNHSDVRITFRYCGIEEEEIAGLREEMGGLLI